MKQSIGEMAVVVVAVECTDLGASYGPNMGTFVVESHAVSRASGQIAPRGYTAGGPSSGGPELLVS